MLPLYLLKVLTDSLLSTLDAGAQTVTSAMLAWM